MHEGIPILDCHVPKAFLHDERQAHRHELREGARGARRQGPAPAGAHRRARAGLRMRRGAGRGRPGERVPVDRARLRHRLRRMGHAGARRGDAAVERCRTSSSAATRRSGPKNIIWAVAQATRRRSRSTSSCTARTSRMRPPPGVDAGVAEDGHPRVELRQRRSRPTCATRCRGATSNQALRNIKVEVELGFDVATAWKEAQRCLNCDVQTVFTDRPVHRVRRLRRHLPDGLHHLHRQRRRGRPAHAAAARRRATSTQELYVVERAEDRPRDGQGRGRLPALRPVRRALPDRRLGHAEVPDRA